MTAAAARAKKAEALRAEKTAEPARKHIRYAVVGLGHIAQVAMLPAFAHARANSRLTALVSEDPRKRKMIAQKYEIEQTFGYDDFEACLEHVDAVYIALPNSMHAEFTIRAARQGVHVLCEKPMAVTTDECTRMIDACRANDVKLMIAYRLHFEAINLRVVELVKRGSIGEPRYFQSSFSMRVKPGNIRTKRELGGGTLYDIGVYCINAARSLFRSEPREVMASSVHTGGNRLSEVDATTAALLRFEGERVAAFVSSFDAADVASYRIVGTKGQIEVDPAYEYAEGLEYRMTVDGKTERRRSRRRDQFAPELIYFSDCILRNKQPEPSGASGRQDVRIVEALYESADTGRAVRIPPFEPGKHPDSRQRITRAPVDEPELVHAESASE